MRTPVKAMLCSKLAIATALVVGATPAAAQSFQGTVDSSSGIGSIATAPSGTTINVTSSQAVINWTATGSSGGGLTTFQASGTTATFQGVNNFAVLNRVQPTVSGDGIYMNGTINSLVNGQVGGTVYFYSPNGIVIGQNASINVGSLGLTTLPINDSEGMWIDFAYDSPQVVFNLATNPLGYVRTDAGSQLNANGFGSYVALVAPRVEHRGTIRTDGAAALVGAAGATITFRTNNLYDIQITEGSTDANGVVVDGGTIERNSDAIGGDHRAYLVAVPANNAMTMLVQAGAKLGFDIAGSAGVEGNAVVLSAGGDVSDGDAAVAAGGDAAINLRSATVTSDFAAVAAGRIDIGDAGGPTSFSGNVDLASRTQVSVAAIQSNISIGGNLTARADVTGGLGEDATGGIATVSASGTGSLTIAGSATLSADGFGGGDYLGAGGNGFGGQVSVTLSDGGVIDVTGNLTLSAQGEGGYQSGGGVAGNGTGGDAAINLLGSASSQLTVSGTTELDTAGYGGGTGETGGGTAGNGTGGWSRIYGTGGTGNFAGAVTIAADGTGGDGDYGGLGGNGTGGRARFNADGATLQVMNDLTLKSISTGGNGGTGGNAIAQPTTAATPTDARILTGNGGSVTVNGTALADASAYGGNGSNGSGGNATAGSAGIFVDWGSATLGDLDVAADGFGGNGSNGGNGGNGRGGQGRVEAWGSNTALLSANDIDVSAEGTGGDGGTGTGGNSGGAGGGGGTGIGGSVSFWGSAANGTLVASGDSVALAGGFGGDGGAGGDGDSGTGGNGGAGGAGTGGSIQLGTVSNSTAAGSSGGATYAALSADSSAIGGGGGNGGSGEGGSGLGGNGGAATGGSPSFLARGVLVTADSVNLQASATGGDGGLGSIRGNGGNAATGRIAVESVNRFELPLQRGTLIANSIVALADATGGAGFENGIGSTAGTSYFRLLNGDASIGSFTLLVAADAIGPDGLEDFVSIINGTATVSGNFNFTTTDEMSALAENGSLTAETLTLAAGNFVRDVVNAPPLTIGTISAGAISVTSGLDIIVDAHLVSTSSLDLDAPGLIGVRNLTSADGEFNDIMLRANGTITAETINADGSVDVDSGSDVMLGDVTAGNAIDFEAEGSVTGGNMTAGLEVKGSAEGAISLGAISAGLVNPQGPPELGFSVGITSGTSISVGDVAGAEAVGFATLGALTTGDISAGTDVLGLASGDMSLGAITAGPNGRTYLADSSMFIAAGGGDDGEFMPELVFGAAPVASPGSITINGPVTTGSFQAAAASISAGDIDANSFIEMFAGGPIDASGDITTGTIDATSVELVADGNIDVGNATVSEWFDAEAVGSLQAGNITAGDYIGLSANLALIAGNLSAGIVDPSTAFDADYSIGILSGTSVQLGNVNALGWVGIGSLGSLGAGSITSGDDVLLAADGNINVGAITFGNGNRLLIAGFDMVAIGQGETEDDDFDRSLLFAAVDEGAGVPSGGSVTIDGSVNGGTADIFAGEDFSVGAMNLADRVRIETGGSLASGNINANGQVTLLAGGNMATGNVGSTLGSIDATAIGNASLGSLTAEGNIDLFADGSLTAGNVVAGLTATAQAVGNVSLGNINAQSINIGSTAGSVVTDDLTATLFGINIGADGNIGTGNATSAQYFFASAGGDIATENLAIAGDADFEAGDDISTGTIAAGDVDFFADGDVEIGNAIVDGVIDVEAGGALNAQNVTAGGEINLAANLALIAGDLSAGIVNPSENEGVEYNIGVISWTSVEIGDVEALGWVGLASLGSLDAGSIQSGDDVLIAADGNVQTGAITTGGESRLLIAGFDMVEVGGGADEDFDRSLVFEAVDDGNAIATNGSVTIGGPVETARLDIFAGSNVTVGDLNLGGEGNIDAGGLLTLNGDINNEVRLTSNDIIVAEGVTVDAAQLVSRNAQGTFIGDGLTGTGGYRLSNAEYNRFGALDVAADLALGAGSTMTIGDLTVANAGNAEWDFTVINGDGEGMGDGTIRVVGDVLFTDMDSDGEGGVGAVDFTARRFELDAATGSISLEDGSGGLAGILEIEAQRVHVAEGAILDQLVSDPGYAGLADDLATPTATAAPEGVIRAGEIYIYLNQGAQATPTYSVYVQNTGTAATRAGFVANYAEIDTPEGTPPGSIDLIVNGQLETEGGTLTGVDVRDALMDDDDPARFTATSTINGCALAGPCVFQQPPPPNPVPDIAAQITLIGAPTRDDQPFGNEEAIEDNEEDGGEQGAASPIQPPLPLFNTQPLEQSGETDEPVSGGGNPALIGNGSDDDVDDDDDEEDK